MAGVSIRLSPVREGEDGETEQQRERPHKKMREKSIEQFSGRSP